MPPPPDGILHDLGLTDVACLRDQHGERRLRLSFACGCRTSVGFTTTDRRWCPVPGHWEALICFIEPQAMTGLVAMPSSLWMPRAVVS